MKQSAKGDFEQSLSVGSTTHRTGSNERRGELRIARKINTPAHGPRPRIGEQLRRECLAARAGSLVEVGADHPGEVVEVSVCERSLAGRHDQFCAALRTIKVTHRNEFYRHSFGVVHRQMRHPSVAPGLEGQAGTGAAGCRTGAAEMAHAAPEETAVQDTFSGPRVPRVPHCAKTYACEAGLKRHTQHLKAQVRENAGAYGGNSSPNCGTRGTRNTVIHRPHGGTR